MSLYLWINLLTIIGPFALSFDKKVAFYKQWKFVFPAILIVAVGFLLWDEYFTANGIWGFNPEYLQGIYIGNLPLEEVLFFITIPYACVFIFSCIDGYFPNHKFNKLGYTFSFAFTIAALVLAFYFYENWYTFYALLGAGILNAVLYFGYTPIWYGRFVVAFLIAVLPFILVNGILTGMFTENPIVWYNENHIIGLRIGTIPIEDLFYNFFMLFSITAIFQYLLNRKQKKHF
ncbi:MAG: lycopene cyclase domain-containing protein [Lishizhenia sp.]